MALKVNIQNPENKIEIQQASVDIHIANQPAMAIDIGQKKIEVNIQKPQINVKIGCGCSGNGGDGGGPAAWGDITGNLPDQTDLQAALDGKSNTGHTHPLSDLTQSGATVGQIARWDGAAWVPDDEAGGGPGGASYTEVTYSEMEALIAANGLTPGGWYLITDATGTDLGFLTNAVTENEINVSGVGGYLNADFQAVGDYSGTPETFGAQLGIWRTGFEALTIPYTNLDPAQIEYSTSSGLLNAGEGYTTPYTPPYIYYTGASGLFAPGETITGDDNGSTAEVVSDDGAGTLEVTNVTGDWNTESTFIGDTSTETAGLDGYDEEITQKTGVVITDNGSIVQLVPDQPLEAGDVITGDISGNTVTVDTFDAGGGTFAVGDTITGGTTGATAVIVTDDGASSMTAYMTSAGVAFDGSEVLDNGSGVTANMDGAATGPTIVLGDVVIWNLLHYQLTDAALLDGTDPSVNLSELSIISYFDNSGAFSISETITGGNGATAIIVTDNGAGALTISAETGDWSAESSFVGETSGVTAGIEGYQPGTSGAYTLLSKTTENVGYVTAWDVSEYDVTGNSIEYRQDLRGGLVRGATGVAGYQFGRDACSGNNIQSPATFDIRNLVAAFNNNTIFPGAIVSGIVTGADTTIENNTLENGAQLINISALGSCVISNNKIYPTGTLSGITLGQSCVIQYNNIGTASAVYDIILMQGAVLDGNSLIGSASINTLTIGESASLIANTLFAAATVQNISIGSACSIENNILENGASLTGITAGANCSISRNKIGQGATLGGSTTMGDGTSITDNELASIATISSNTLLAGDIRRNKLGGTCSINNNVFNPSARGVSLCTLTACGINDCIFNADGQIEGATLIYANITASTFGNSLIAVSLSNIPVESKLFSGLIEGAICSPGVSTFAETIDITGLPALDCLAENNFVGTFNLTSSNATESIDTITNPPTLFPTILKNNQTGLALTITGTPYAGIGAGQIALKAASYTLAPGEYIVLDYDPATGCLIENRVVNAIL